ncbi:MAG: hypothetical protein RR630_06145 [Coprobacillus sp.]
MGKCRISDIVRNLEDAGCHPDMIEKFMCSYENDYIQNQMSLLKKQRCILIEKIHQDQKQIDCLDYLIYMIKSNPR